MNKNLYPWLKSLYKIIIKSNLFIKDNFGLIIKFNSELKIDVLIFNIVKWMFCTYKLKSNACNNCINCVLLNNKNHPNFYIFKNDFLHIEKVKYLNKVFSNNLYVSVYKVIYFSNFDFKNKFINNFLLRIIEESLYNVIIIFTCWMNFIIPATLFSRCYKYNLYAPNENIILKWIYKKKLFNNFDKYQLLTAIRISNNSPTLTIFLLTNLWKLRIKFINDFSFMFFKNHNYLFNNKIFSYKNNFLINYIYWFIYILLDLLKISISYNNLIYNIDYIKKIYTLSREISNNKIFLILDELYLFLNKYFNLLNYNKKILLYKLNYNIFFILNN